MRDSLFGGQSARTMLWSEIPGIEVIDLTSEGLLQQKRSRRFWSLVGSLCICFKPASLKIESNFSFNVLLDVSWSTVQRSQLIPPALKSPPKMRVVVFELFRNLCQFHF